MKEQIFNIHYICAIKSEDMYFVKMSMTNLLKKNMRSTLQHKLSASIMKRICTSRTLTPRNCMLFTIFKICFFIDTLRNLLLFADSCHNFLSSHPLCFILIRDVYLRPISVLLYPPQRSQGGLLESPCPSVCRSVDTHARLGKMISGA